MAARAGRELDWDGCFNVRDLGGLPAAGGRRTRPGALVRADNLDGLTEAGWAAVADHGVRTVIDLRNAIDHRPRLPRPEGIGLVRVPVDELAGNVRWWREWGHLEGTPLTWAAYLEYVPKVAASVVREVAAAPPGGVVVHCTAGRDRTGFASFVLLTLAGVAAADIAADYLLSGPNHRRAAAALGHPDQTLEIAEIQTRSGRTATQVVTDTHATFDAAAYLTKAGLPDSAVAAARERLLAPG
ncbi:tyrosine-protein phosphatase [Streptomyces sp. CMB-StM0423]|uniref:tyrosine-protein phosphatase n=1 Tax=Streptomyces sp. CMB-StM0423 TaxID=2059884 RepID=UPI000C713ED3|nr:tyrosine-protein phosphatase [Streptomyces sp. CMB-StM0423]AUH39674.1 protein-tyrosine-phosphatase [Streptomyces sp. CMB-StM0423]